MKPLISSQAIAQLLPDISRLVETRDILLAGGCQIFGLRQQPGLSFVVLDADQKTIYVEGLPQADALHEAMQAAEQLDSILSLWANAESLGAALPGFTPARIFVHELPGSESLPFIRPGVVRFLERSTFDQLDLPEELLGDLKSSPPHSLCAAVYVGERPVSFCYLSSETEGLWDISIDTLPDFQRRGYASQCAAFMIGQMQKLGKEPVWMALEDNPASWRLANKLGFIKVDELAVFERAAS